MRWSSCPVLVESMMPVIMVMVFISNTFVSQIWLFYLSVVARRTLPSACAIEFITGEKLMLWPCDNCRQDYNAVNLEAKIHYWVSV